MDTDTVYWPSPIVRQVVTAALAEDLAGGDLTTEATVDPGAWAEGALVLKADGVVAGSVFLAATFAELDPRVSVHYRRRDGEALAGTVLADLAGPARALLAGERVALNLLQHLSGVATLTARYVAAVAGTKTRITDTRKTLPGLRTLERLAVRVGGGVNHRYGLGTGILIKENHIRLAGGVEQAIQRARRLAGPAIRVEVEVDDVALVAEALAAGADCILLDNLSLPEIAQALAEVAGRVPVEVSGGVTLEKAREAARLGVDFVSVGALTHSAPALDISLELYARQASCR